ncbi:hypothetical protein INR49_011744 [Caranx melampygus]|nr:hypothetical protein INR49_011744 [Caranx melampygus]
MEMAVDLTCQASVQNPSFERGSTQGRGVLATPFPQPINSPSIPRFPSAYLHGHGVFNQHRSQLPVQLKEDLSLTSLVQVTQCQRLDVEDLPSLQLHLRWQRGTRAALNTGERLQHLGEDVKRGEKGGGGELLGSVLSGFEVEEFLVLIDELGVHGGVEELVVGEHILEEWDVGLEMDTDRHRRGTLALAMVLNLPDILDKFHPELLQALRASLPLVIPCRLLSPNPYGPNPHPNPSSINGSIPHFS